MKAKTKDIVFLSDYGKYKKGKHYTLTVSKADSYIGVGLAKAVVFKTKSK